MNNVTKIDTFCWEGQIESLMFLKLFQSIAVSKCLLLKLKSYVDYVTARGRQNAWLLGYIDYSY